MKKSDLSTNADVYRFLIYDRNGDTTRQCDWFLKHREGKIIYLYNLKYYLKYIN